jgi:hypothetical protein
MVRLLWAKKLVETPKAKRKNIVFMRGNNNKDEKNPDLKET